MKIISVFKELLKLKECLSMRGLSWLYVLVFILAINPVQSQDVKELPFVPYDSSATKLFDKINEIDKDESKSSEYIELCINGLKNSENPEVRYALIYWGLSHKYAELNQYDKCFEILKKGHDEGLFYIILEREKPYPSYLKELEKHNKNEYDALLEKNKQLKDEANKLSNTEYMIQLPSNYNKNKQYPLFLIMHGGVGSIKSMQAKYSSENLKNDYIVAFFQGSFLRATGVRSFSRDVWQERIEKGFNQIINNYSVDTSKVILAGPSAGGARSISLGFRNVIPSKGLLLSFPVPPKLIDSLDYINAANKKLKISMICGENDWAIKQQKELAYKFDKYGIENRFVVFPEKGHQFPDNWPYYIDTSLEFLLKKNEN